MDHGQTREVVQVMHIGGPNILVLTLPHGPLPPDPILPPLLTIILPFMIFVLSAFDHWIRKDYDGKSELFDKSMMTCLKSIVIYMVVGVIIFSFWAVIFYG